MTEECPHVPLCPQRRASITKTLPKFSQPEGFTGPNQGSVVLDSSLVAGEVQIIVVDIDTHHVSPQSTGIVRQRSRNPSVIDLIGAKSEQEIIQSFLGREIKHHVTPHHHPCGLSLAELRSRGPIVARSRHGQWSDRGGYVNPQGGFVRQEN